MKGENFLFCINSSLSLLIYEGKDHLTGGLVRSEVKKNQDFSIQELPFILQTSESNVLEEYNAIFHIWIKLQSNFSRIIFCFTFIYILRVNAQCKHAWPVSRKDICFHIQCTVLESYGRQVEREGVGKALSFFLFYQTIVKTDRLKQYWVQVNVSP